MYYHAISHLLHHFSTNCPKRPEQFVVGLILNASFRPFVSVGACIFASLSSLPLSWFLSQISPFQNTRELVTAATTERAKQIKFPFNAAADSEHSGKGRSLLHSSAFASDHNQNVPLCVPASPLCECVCECVWLVNLCCRVTLSVLVHMAWGSRRCLWRASLSTSSSATLPLQQGFPHTNGWIFLRASIANH